MWEKYSRQAPFLPAQSPALEVTIATRPLSIVLDPDLNLDEDTALNYLLEMKHVEGFDFIAYSNGTSPLVDGQFSVAPLDDAWSAMMAQQVTYIHGTVTSTTAVVFVDEAFRRVQEWESHNDGANCLSRESLLACLGAESQGFHLFVTDSDFLLSNPGRFKIHPVTPSGALAFIGLKMRLAGKCIFAASSNFKRTASNRWAFFLESRYLMETVAKFSISDASPNRYFTLLFGAVQRGQHLLRVRDELVIFQMCPPQTYLTDPIFSFETFWIYSSGIFDCISKALNEAFRLGVPVHSAKFHRPRFQSSLMGSLPAVSTFIQEHGTYELVQIVSELRNTIHEEPSSTSSEYQMEEDYFVRVTRDASDLLKQHSELFNLQSTFAFEDTDGHLHIKPIAFIERVLPHLLFHFNGIANSANWPRISAPPPLFSESPENTLFIGSAQRNHLLFGLGE